MRPLFRSRAVLGLSLLHRGVALLLFLLFSGSALANEAFRCAHCQQIVERGFHVDGKFYCSEDLNLVLPKCFNCEAPIQGNYVAVSPAKYPVCLNCRNALPQCFLCSLPCDGQRGGIALSDGRYACRLHAKGGVTSGATARKLFKRARQELDETFSGVLEIKTPIKAVLLVDVNGLKQIAHHSGHAPSLSGGKVLGIATVVLVSQGDKVWMEPSTVHLLNHVPEIRLLTVSTHEYAHVWHAENHQNYTQTESVLREGFAEWVAYKVAQRYGRQDQIALMENPNSGEYYRGLQKFLAIERRQGIDGVLKYATTATGF
jgi:hypothetical protein